MLLGRGETQPPAELDRSPVELPDDRPVTGDDVRALRISVVLRGYRMTEVDWLLEQFALILDERDAEIAALRARLHPAGRHATRTEQAPAEPTPREPDDEEAPACLSWSSGSTSTRRRSRCGPLLTDWERQGEWMLATDVRDGRRPGAAAARPAGRADRAAAARRPARSASWTP